ncbi:MAG: DUF5333 domain-containing protein [Paracoccaceae bacterium]
MPVAPPATIPAMLLALIVAVMLSMASPAAAKVPLRDIPDIDNGLLAVAIADDLRKTCASLNARMLRALGTLHALKSRARDLGYSDKEISEYVSSDKERARMKARGAAWLSARGVAKSDKARYCALGEDEVARGTAVGRLLRVKKN